MKHCIIHLEHPKTGTTYLQTVLYLNQDVFDTSGYWVPSDFTEFGSYDYRELARAGINMSANLQPVFDAAEAKDPEAVNRLIHYIWDCPAFVDG